ncbi:MAG: TonB-dependent receptor [Wenzhouxiangellaceae bacterium]|nr:TonB-dependent receptor [Wenzhouxiangellaceae bacterium]
MMRDSPLQRFLSRAGLLLGLLLIAVGLIMTPHAQGQAEEAGPGANAPARLEVLVFEGGRPVDDLTVRFADVTGRTEDGSWRADVAPAASRLTVFDNAQALTALPLTLRPGEIVQVIITLKGAERRAMVSVESSYGESQVELDAPGRALEGNGEQGSGILSGRVVSTEDGEPIEDARLFVSGTPIELRTDEEGRFEVEVRVGEYSVSVLHSEFATRTIENVAIAAEDTTERNFELPPAGLELAEFVVIEPFIEGSLSSVIDEQRSTASVANVLGAEQISRAGDGDAGSALARVTGLTLVDGQFIFIRGLGERYSSTLLNGANVPSPDPTRKVVPLDLFPTGVIRSINVQKGYSPDMPGDFGGGVVEIRTRGIPEEDFFKLGISTGFRDGTTFEKGLTYDGGERDFTGFDDGTRELPGPIAEATAGGDKLPAQESFFNPDGITPEELEALGESFSNIYDVERERIGPDRSASIEGGKLLELSDGFSAGLTGSVLWDDAWESRTEDRQTFIPLGDGSLRSNDDFVIDRTTRTINLTGFLAAGLNYRDLHEIDASSMILRQTEDETTSQVGFNLDEDGDIKINELEWEERELIANQLRGRHVFEFVNGASLEWDYSESRARLDTPDQRRYRFDPDGPDGFIFSRRSDGNVRRFTDLIDKSLDYGADVALPFEVGFFDAELSGGYRQLEKDRDSSIRRFQFDQVSRLSQETRRLDSVEEILAPENIGPNGVELAEITRPSDNYTAALDVDAIYGNLDMTIAETLRISGGLRVEDWAQTVTTFDLFAPDSQPIISSLGDEDLFPAVSLTWFMTDRQQLRASYAETIIRPDFKELSPAPFTDPVLEREVIGNPDVVSSDVTHFDLRWEFYPSGDELISLGAFYKLIDQPIELTVQPGVEQRLSFANAEEAENFGVEFEARKQLGFLDSWLDSGSIFDKFYLAGNVSLIESEITIPPESQGILTETSRELQGQSPLIVNLQAGYDNPDLGIQATVLYNFVGERIVEVGVLGAPDKIEQGAGELDIVFRWQLNDFLSLSAKAGNLLDSPFEILQGPEITQKYTTGRTLDLGLTFDFL